MNLETYPNFDQMLLAAGAKDRQTREQAEQGIRSCRDENMVMFVISLVKEISNAQNEPTVLQMATIVFRNSIMKSQRDENGNGLWTGALDEQLRQNIKEALLSNLAIEDKTVAKLTGQCIAAIASEEIPRGLWNELIQMLVENCTKEDNPYGIKLAAIQTLGYISDDIDPTSLSKELVEQILHGTTFNINHSDQIEITRNASKALMRAIPVTGPYFAADQHRTIIMQGLLKAADHEDDEVSENALQALNEVPRIGFEYLVPHLADIGQLTVQTMQKNDNSKAMKYLLEFWANLCKEENERNKQGNKHSNMESCWKDVMNIALQSSMLVEFGEDEEQVTDVVEEENTVASSAAQLLQELSPLVKLSLWNEVEQFLKDKLINGQTWIDRYIGFQTLGSIVQSCQDEPDRLTTWVQGSLNLLTTETVPKIRLVAMWTLYNVAQFAPQLLIMNDPRDITINIFINGIQQDHQRIKTHAALTLKHLFESCNSNNNVDLMQPFFKDVFAAIENQIFQPQAVLQTSFTGFIDALNTIFEVCDGSNRTLDTLIYFLGKVQEILNDSNILGQNIIPEQVEVFLNNYCGLCQICMAYVKIEQPDFSSNVVQLIVAMFNKLQKVNVGGLIMLNGLVESIGENILNHVDELGRFIVKGTQLNEDADHMVCRLSIGLISDFSNNLQEKINPYIQGFFQCIEEVLASDDHETASKIVAIIAVGDLCLASEENYSPYVSKALDSITSAAKLSLLIDEISKEDIEQLNDLSMLREAVLDGYLSILHGMNMQDANNNHQLSNNQKEEYALQMFQFLEALVQDATKYDLNHSILKQIFELFTDLALICFERVNNQSQSVQYRRLAEYIKNSQLPHVMPNAIENLQNDESSGELKDRFHGVIQMIQN